VRVAVGLAALAIAALVVVLVLLAIYYVLKPFMEEEKQNGN